ncbi:Pkinase-domain-containing protein [Eremomyces bilateralis CBS 781.70]|uniref:cyclin-dependent kinase n=1 Tax=Eremomyces bilateralis CBS 781.70 TaxID=1392243 RepID=A0A6G1FV53_9PEZI|nr:Pkinase-domain-containing protein [Eremomyces bilateralis CBS 781.70]KAF1809643.1 Pkinase-domain-containing protein [Eremomyces bilateralis CBS 781.70]
MRFNHGQPQPRQESRLESRLGGPDRKSEFRPDYRSDHRHDHRHDHRSDHRDRHDSRGDYRSDHRGDYRDSRDSRRDGRDYRDSRDHRDARGPREHRDPRDARHPRDRRPEPRFEKRPKPPPKAIFRIVKKAKPRPSVKPEFQGPGSIYYRKPGNESVVGSGTYGKVFKADHIYTNNMVALKRIRVENEKDGFPVTAIREVKLLEHLRHDNVVQLLEVMVEDNHCYMVFEYLSHDLTGLLNHPSYKLDEAQKKDLAKQMFEGLDYLHHRGVLHRDIKAANILVSNSGQLKIADFGLARFYSKVRRLDYTNRVITIWYRSPELLFGETQYGPAVDIWSAACVLVEIFTNYAIFPGDGTELNQLQKIYDVLGAPTLEQWPGMRDTAWYELLINACKPRASTFESKYRDKLTPAAYELLTSMLDYDPANRPTANDVLEHPYFTVEQPAASRAVELANIQGDWHEFESKALRKEREQKKKEKDRHERERERHRQKELKRRVDDGDAHDKGGEHDRKRIRSEQEKDAERDPSGGLPSPRIEDRKGDLMEVDPV